MKKRIFVVLMALCLLAGTSAFAQEQKMMPKERPTAEQMAQRKADRMKEKLSLNDAQTKQIYEMNLSQIKEMQVLRKKMKSDRMAHAAKMKGILTPEQYKQWEEMHSQMKMHGRKDGMRGKGDCKQGKPCCEAKQGSCKGTKPCCEAKQSCCKSGKKCNRPAPNK